jgi:omega-6 fatty acid desaturase (delta-12 desaturase)
MGKGGQAPQSASAPKNWVSPYNPLAKDAPELPSKGEIKAVIPKECFERSYVHSMWFVLRDTAMAAGCAFVAYQTLSTELPSQLLSVEALKWFLGWNAYAFWQGCILTGHWVLAHECGHGAFSPSQTFNDFWGFIMHQALLVPYFAWQYTHAKHHRRTNNIMDGEIIDHYRPWSKMFPSKLRLKIAISTLGVIAAWYGILEASRTYGVLPVMLWYIGPLLWNQAWLVLYTWLQHNDPSVPHYGTGEWTWVKGALSTIDRPYGIFDFFHHKIGSTHVAHHLFHEMPFYKADVATAAIKAYLEPKGLYNYDPTPWYVAMWRIAKTCHYIDDFDGIQYYKSLEDVPLSKKGKSD